MKIKLNNNPVVKGLRKILDLIAMWPEVECIDISEAIKKSRSAKITIKVSYWLDDGLRCLFEVSGGKQEVFIRTCNPSYRKKIEKKLEALNLAQIPF